MPRGATLTPNIPMTTKRRPSMLFPPPPAYATRTSQPCDPTKLVSCFTQKTHKTKILPRGATLTPNIRMTTKRRPSILFPPPPAYATRIPTHATRQIPYLKNTDNLYLTSTLLGRHGRRARQLSIVCGIAAIPPVSTAGRASPPRTARARGAAVEHRAGHCSDTARVDRGTRQPSSGDTGEGRGS